MSQFKYFISASLMVVCILCINGAALAQTDSLPSSRSYSAFSISIQPLFALNSALKLDFEVQKPTGRFSYIVSPEIYAGNITDTSIPKSDRNNPISDEIKGYGLGIQHKVKFKKQPLSPYFAYGVTYRRQTITYVADDFASYNENGLVYYRYGPVESPIKINSMLLQAVLGVQTLDWNILVADIYAGFGHKFADMDIANPNLRRYNKTFLGPAYDGTMLLFGLKLGVQIKR